MLSMLLLNLVHEMVGIPPQDPKNMAGAKAPKPTWARESKSEDLLLSRRQLCESLLGLFAQ